MLSRRSFLTTGIVLIAAPAIIKVAKIMPVKAYEDVVTLTGNHTIPSCGIFNPLFNPEQTTRTLPDWIVQFQAKSFAELRQMYPEPETHRPCPDNCVPLDT